MATAVTYTQLEQRVNALGSVGVLLPGARLRVVRPDGTLAARAELGELYIRSPSMALGYLDNPTA